MNKRYLMTLGTLMAACIATPVMAQSSTFTVQEEIFSAPMMKTMDKNKDGKVSRAEFLAYMGAQFDMMDRNKDKMLDNKEQADKDMMQKTFTRYDS